MISQSEVDTLYAQSTQETLVGLYAKRDTDSGKPKETVSDIVNRVAEAVALAEIKYVLTPKQITELTLDDARAVRACAEAAKEFSSKIGRQVFWANTPANINADPEVSLKVLQYWAHGVLAGFEEHEIWLKSEELRKAFEKDGFDENGPHQSKMGELASQLKGRGCLAACGVAFVEDSLEGIQEAARIESLAAKAAMGMGINTSTLRPWSSILSNGAAASGPDRFYGKTIAQAVEAVAQGGRRGGALIELRNSDHPDILFFIDKKKLIPPPSFPAIYRDVRNSFEADTEPQSILAIALKKFGERYHDYLERQQYLKNTNITVLAMPGFMEAVSSNQWYPAFFDGMPWSGPLFDPRRPKLLNGSPVVNKLTKEQLYEEYSVSLTEYPEAARAIEQTTHSVFQKRSVVNGESRVSVPSHFYAPEVFKRIVEGMRDSGEPGIAFYETVNKGNANDHVYDLNTCNPCFAPGTYILTKEGYFRIETLVGKTVTIWDGEQWTKVDNFRVTGENQPILEIEMESGFTIKATPYHRFLLEGGAEVQAKNLVPGMRLQTHDKQYHGNHIEPGAYLKGFLSVAASRGIRPTLWLYDTKFVCAKRLEESAREVPVTNAVTNTVTEVDFIGFDSNKAVVGGESTYSRYQMRELTARRESLEAWATTHQERLPLDEMLNWSKESKCEFIAGVFDGNAGAQDSQKNGFRYQLTSVEKDYLQDIQMLMASIGVESKLSLNKKTELKDFGSNRGGKCYTQNLWRLTINQPNAIRLAKQVRFERIVSFAHKTTKEERPTTWNQVLEVKDAGVSKKVYCCTVDTTNQFSLLPYIVRNCGEQFLPAGPGKDGRFYMGNCNLSSMHAAHPDFWNADGTYNFAAMKTAVYYQQRFMDNVTDVSWYPIPEQNMTARMERRNGGGFAGVAEFLSRLGFRFGSPEGIGMVGNLYREYNNASVQVSQDLARDRGTYPLWPGSRFQKKGLKMRNSCLTNNAPTGTLAQALQTSWGVDPHNGIVFSRKVRSRYVDFVAPGFKEAMIKHGAWPESEEERQALIQRIRDNNKSCQGLAGIPIEVQNAFPIRVEISPDEYITHLAAIHAGCSDFPEAFNSVSNTCSIPIDSKEEAIAQAVMLAWGLGVKDITFYPDGSRLSQPVEKIASATYDSDTDYGEIFSHRSIRKISTSNTEGLTYKVAVGSPDGGSKLHVSLNHEAERPGELIEVYARMGKPGAIESGLFEAVGRLASTFLQFAAERGEDERAFAEETIIKQLINIQSGYPAFFQFPGESKSIVVQSPCDGLARAIQHYRTLYAEKPVQKPLSSADLDPTALLNLIDYLGAPGPYRIRTCPKCGSQDFEKVDGCSVCQSCGYSSCG